MSNSQDTDNPQMLKEVLSEIRSAMLNLKPVKFEYLAGELLGELLNVPVSFARSGSQRGGDVSVSGVRDIKLEARRYSNKSKLDERGILGQIEQSIDQEPALEAWILATTKVVPDQIVRSCTSLAEREGIAFVYLDWSGHQIPRLAALAAKFPKVSLRYLDAALAKHLSFISEVEETDRVVGRLLGELESWAIGYKQVRDLSHKTLRKLWAEPHESLAIMNQDVAGGSVEKRFLRRTHVFDSLETWYTQKKAAQSAILVGRDGAGKTWAAIDWLQARLNDLPIVILVSSQNLGGPPPSNASDVKALLAKQLYALSRLRDEAFWHRRIDRLLNRPDEEGLVFVLMFDGLNEPASNKWLPALRQFSAQPFDRRVGVIATTRRHHFQTRLNHLSNLAPKPKIIQVSAYDLSPGGEFDRKLKLEGISRECLAADVIDLASVPRFFDLVIELKNELDGLDEITVPRLLWEYGRVKLFEASQETLTHEQWNAIIFNLAEKYRDGTLPQNPDGLSGILSSPTQSADEVASRVSSMANGICAELGPGNQLSYRPEFVNYALGFAVLESLNAEASVDIARASLDNWLDGISGFDERGSVLEAAGCLAAATPTRFNKSGVSAVIAAWVETQNLTEDSVEKLTAICPSLPIAFLDAIELSTGRNLATARYLAINAFSGVRVDDPGFACLLADRLAKWHCVISLDLGLFGQDPTDENSSAGRRRKRLIDRLGSYNSGGTFSIGEHEFSIVENSDTGLHTAGAQLLQGRPLARCTRFFEAASIHAAIVGPSFNHEAHGWLNRLNTVDPEETAIALRISAKNLRKTDLPPNAAPNLGDRIASLILWKTGYEEDAAEAWRIDPKIDYGFDYETDYLNKPSRSFGALERRHMCETLLDHEVGLIRRIERCKSALLDPTFNLPEGFVSELRGFADKFDTSQLDIGRGRTPADLHWEILSVALARSAPDCLAEIERSRMRGFRNRSSTQRYGAALAAGDAYLLVAEEERSAMAAIRSAQKLSDDDNERYLQNLLLAAEIQGLNAIDQYRRVIGANLKIVFSTLADATLAPTKDDVDTLLNEYSGEPAACKRLLDLLAYNQVELSDSAFELVLEQTLEANEGGNIGPAWPLLSRSGATRFANALLERDWRWSEGDNFWAAYHGSKALALAEPDQPYENIAGRIAPAFLLRFLSARKSGHDEIELAADILTKALLLQDVHIEEPVAELILDQERAQQGGYDYSIGRTTEDIANEGNLGYALSAEVRAEKRSAAVKAAIEQVRTARQKGAQLHLVQICADDFDPIFKHCPDAIETWLDGVEDFTDSAIQRIRLAEGFYVALCQKLLDVSPAKGLSLWRLLRAKLFTRFLGVGGVNTLIHIAFQAKTSLEVTKLRDELYSLQNAQTDQDLIDILVAARTANCEDWLIDKVAADKRSHCPAHHLRAAFLGPLVSLPKIAQQAEWPTGQALAGPETVRRSSWATAQHEAYAHHWVRKYAEADNPIEAHAAWRLVEASSDPRVRTWMMKVYEEYTSGEQGSDNQLDVRKRVFSHARSRELYKAMDARAKSWSREFGGRRISSELFPWNGSG